MPMTQQTTSGFHVRLAETKADLEAAQRLRYDVFVSELGGGGAMVDHDAGLERDQYDPFFDHLLLIDDSTGAVVGVYRLMQQHMAQRAGRFYSSGEYDLTPLETCGRRILELGRSCLHPDYRGGMAMHCLWSGLADYIDRHRIEVLFGVASFHGTDVAAFKQPLAFLHHRHLAPPELRVAARETSFQNMDLLDEAELDRKAAMLQMPSLIKAYLRLGGMVGAGAYVDHAFNTVDVCLILDTNQMNARQSKIYRGGQR